MQLSIKLDDGNEYVVSPTPSDFIKFERHFNQPVSVVEEGRIEYIAYLCWAGLTRLKKVSTSFDDFCDSIESFVPKAQA